MTDLTTVFSAAIALLTAAAAAVLMPWLKEKLSQQQLARLLKWVDIAVAAAQQLYFDRDGSRRKEYVLETLKRRGYDVDSAEIDSAIEAAVLRLHQQLEGV